MVGLESKALVAQEGSGDAGNWHLKMVIVPADFPPNFVSM